MPQGFHSNDWQELLTVAAAIELGVFDELDRQPATAAALAGRLGYDERATRILMDALAHLGHIHRDGYGAFQLDAHMRAVAVDPESPAFARNAILHHRNHVERWLTIPEVVRRGAPAPRRRTEDSQRVFIGSMDDNSRATVADVADRCLRRAAAARTVIDIGGGPGTYAREFVRRGLRVTVLDTPEVKKLTGPGLCAIPGIDFVAGDFQTALPPGPFDLALMGNILHIYGPGENLALLERVRDILNPGGTAAILEMVRGRDRRAALFALTMLVNTEAGDAWTEEEYRNWLSSTGFASVTVEDIPGRGNQLILANRAD